MISGSFPLSVKWRCIISSLLSCYALIIRRRRSELAIHLEPPSGNLDLGLRSPQLSFRPLPLLLHLPHFSGPTPRNHRPDTLQHFAPGEQPLTAYNRINIHFWGALALMQDSIWCMLPLPERAAQTFVFLYEFLSGSLPLCTRLSMTTPTCGFTVWSAGSQPQVAEGGRGHSSFLDVTFRPGARRSQLITSAGGQRVKSAYTL